MKKVSKAILIGLAVLVAVGIMLGVFLNLYIQSPGSQARIQEELSKSLRLPLKLTNVSVSPFGGLRITGITIPNGDANFLEAASFNANYRFFPLLHGKLVIREMNVENPKIVWMQTADGKWKLPEPEQAAATSAKEAKVDAPEVKLPAPEKVESKLPETQASKAPESAKPKLAEDYIPKKEGPKPPKRNFAVIVERFDIKGGSVELLDRDNKHVAVFSGVNMTYTTLTPELLEGTATIAKLIWADGVTFENVSTPFKYAADGSFDLPDVNATFAGGKVQGKYYRREEKGHSPYKVAATLTKIDLDKASVQMGFPAGQTVGLLSSQFEVHGDAAQANRQEGEARIDLRDAQFHQLDFFTNIGQLLGMRELADLRVRDGHADVRLSGTKIPIDKVILNTADLQFYAKGMARIDKSLKLAAQLSMEDAVVQHVPGMIRDSFQPSDPGRQAINFTITGSIDKPKTDLVDKLIGKKINTQFGDILNSIFPEGKKPDDRKSRKDEKSPKKTDQLPDDATVQPDAATTPAPAPIPATTPPPPSAANP